MLRAARHFKSAITTKAFGFAVLLATGVATALLTSCASFQGPGPLVLGGDSEARSPAQETQSATAPVDAGTHPPRLTPGEPLNSNAGQVNFDWPVDQARMTRGFFARAAKKSRPHWGVDLANKKDTPILASNEGQVVYTGQGFHGYGKLIVIEHGGEWATLYAHLNKIQVKEGQTVSRGQQIGLMGQTGRAHGTHLHFEIRRFRQPVNPLAFLPEGANPGRLSAQADREGGPENAVETTTVVQHLPTRKSSMRLSQQGN